MEVGVERSVRKPEAAENTAGRYIKKKKIKGTEEGHKTGTGSPGTGSASSVSQ